MKTTIDNFINEVINQFLENKVIITEDITDRVFLMIEKNPRLYREYQHLIKNETSKRGLNARLGKRIREHFCLRNVGRHHNPESKLIKSYERHVK